MNVEEINGIPTHVFSLKADHYARPRNTSLLLVVPGSPGMGHFYIPFATKLFQLGEGCYDVAVVSHAGHSPGHIRPVPSGGGVDGLQEQQQQHDQLSRDPGPCPTGASSAAAPIINHHCGKDWYSLEDQISHKLEYLRKHASNKETLYLVGHSIGSWMILQMLQKLEPRRVKKVTLLFPTIEKMGITPNGQKLAPLFTTLRRPFTALIWLMSNIPNFFRRFVLSRYFHTTPSEHVEHIAEATMNINSMSMYNILRMAHQEMADVVDAPLNIIDEHIEKIVFYYGVGDKWNVESCYENMAMRYPDKDVHLCTKGFPHAFVECASDEMAEFVHSKLLK